MTKAALLAVVGVVGLSFPVSAQQAISPWDQTPTITLEELSLYRPESLSAVNCSSLFEGLPILAFLDQRFLPALSEWGRAKTAPDEIFPIVYVTATRSDTMNAPAADGKDLPGKLMAGQRKPELYFGGETGVFYGRSIGKHGGDDFGSYLEGSVGNDKVQFTVGASYEQSNARVPRWAR